MTPPLQPGYGEGHLRREPDLVADLDILPSGHDLVRAVNVTADQVLQKVVAVETAAPLPQLSDPGPYLASRRADGDGAGRGEVRGADQIIAGQHLAALPGCRAPPELPAPGHQNPGGRNGGQAHDIPTSHFGLPPAVASACPLHILPPLHSIRICRI